MNLPSDDIRLLRAVGDLCNGSLPQDEGAWLDDRLAHDRDACAAYVDYMSLHADLCSGGWCTTGDCSSEDYGDSVQDRLFSGIAETLLQRLGPDSTEAMLDQYVGLPPVMTPPEEGRGAGRGGWFWAAISLALIGVAVSAGLLTYLTMGALPGRPAGVLAGAGEADGVPVARVTGTQNCLWENTPGVIGYGSQLIAGQQLTLLEGLAEVTFGDGATVLLEGPARFVVEDRHEVDLKRGRLAAVVPKRSRGFRVVTRSLEVYDAGTEFGLLARESGAAEVHVFSGPLKADLLDSRGNTRHRVELNASEAIRVSPVSTSVVEFPADETAFVRSLIPKSGPQDGLLAYEGFDYPAGPLSAQNGGFGWAGPWFSISESDTDGPQSNSVLAGSLAVEGIVPKGNRAALTGHKNRIRRSLATSVGGVFDVAGLVENQDGVRLIGRDGHQVYLSFLQRVSKTDDGFYGLELHRGDGNSNRVLCIGNGAEGTGYGVTSNFNVYGLQNFPALGREDDEANLFVVKVSFGIDNRDLVEVYRNPASLRDEQSCIPDAVLKGNFAFDRISLGNFDGGKTHEADEVRVGTHFLAVTGRWGSDRGRLLRRVIHRESDETDRDKGYWQGLFASHVGSHVRIAFP